MANTDVRCARCGAAMGFNLSASNPSNAAAARMSLCPWAKAQRAHAQPTLPFKCPDWSEALSQAIAWPSAA